VRFKQEEPAHACLEKMNGRFFGGQQILAHMWDGFTSYHVGASCDSPGWNRQLALLCKMRV
jgi:hypothetical protein